MSRSSVYIIMLGLASAVVIALVLLYFTARHETTTVKVERTFNAQVSVVWALWTQPENMKKWWGPKGYSAPVIQNDVQPGGSFLFSMRSPKGDVAYNSGKYTKVMPMYKTVAEMNFSDEKGKPVPASFYKIPGEWPPETELTVLMIEKNGKTTVSIQEKGIPAIMFVFARLGWEQQLDKFQALLP